MSLTGKGEHCTIVYIPFWSRRILIHLKLFKCFIMCFNENSTKKFMCNSQYRSSYYNGVALLWKSTMCCDLTLYCKCHLCSWLPTLILFELEVEIYPIYFDLLFFELNIKKSKSSINFLLELNWPWVIIEKWDKNVPSLQVSC